MSPKWTSQFSYIYFKFSNYTYADIGMIHPRLKAPILEHAILYSVLAQQLSMNKPL